MSGRYARCKLLMLDDCCDSDAGCRNTKLDCGFGSDAGCAGSLNSMTLVSSTAQNSIAVSIPTVDHFNVIT